MNVRKPGRLALLTSLALLVGLVLPGVVPTAQAATTTLSSAKDAFIDALNPNSNAGSGQSIDIGFTLPQNVRRRALVAFDLSPIPTGVILLGAVVEFDCGQQLNASIDYGWHLVTSSWSESTVTWNTQPTFEASPAVTETMPTGCPSGTKVRDDITPLIQRWIDGETNEGMVGISSNESTEAFVLLRSKEHPVPPVVEVTLGAQVIVGVLLVVAVVVVALGVFSLAVKKERKLEDLLVLIVLLAVFAVGIGIAVALFAG